MRIVSNVYINDRLEYSGLCSFLDESDGIVFENRVKKLLLNDRVLARVEVMDVALGDSWYKATHLESIYVWERRCYVSGVDGHLVQLHAISGSI